MDERLDPPSSAFPYMEADLLVATCTPGGEPVFRNVAWQAVFGDDEHNPWARLPESDRRQITGALNRAAGGKLVTGRMCRVQMPERSEPLSVLINFLPVYLSSAAADSAEDEGSDDAYREGEFEEGDSRENPSDGLSPGVQDGRRPVQAVTVTGEVVAEPAFWRPSQTQRHRIEALGRMTMGVAHDLNNLLSALLGHSEFLQKRFEQLERTNGAISDLRESLDTIEQVAVDGAALVEKIQRFSRRESQSSFETLDLAALVEGCITLTRPYWYSEPRRRGVSIELKRDLHAVPPIRGAATDLREVFVNLIINAVQAMPSGGRLTLRTSYDEERGVRAVVEDTGTGMSAKVRAHIFEPLFTTKGEHGSGMGLAVSYGIIQEHEGKIRVESSVGEGTRFTLYFAAVEEQEENSEEPEDSVPTSRPARILVVDDEKRVRTVLNKLLSLKGHTVEQATSGAEALALTENGGFDIVFTDYGMPAMNGRQLARALHRRTPFLPVVLLTGDTELEADDEVNRVMSKPFTLDQLEAAIQALL